VYNSVVSSGLVFTTQPAKILYNDIEQSQLFICYPLEDSSRYSLCSFASDSRLNKSFRWRSKINTSAQGLFNLSAARVMMTSPCSVKEREPIKGDKLKRSSFADRVLGGEPINGWCNSAHKLDLADNTVFNYYVDGELKYSREIKDSKPFRLPSGFRGETIEVEIKSNAYIHSITLASSMGELVEGESK
jgi:hypothetical protein